MELEELNLPWCLCEPNHKQSMWGNGFKGIVYKAVKYSDSWDAGNMWGEVFSFPSEFLVRKSKSSCREEESRQSPVDKLKRWSWPSRGTKAVRVHRTKYWRGESCTERELLRYAESRPLVFSWIFISSFMQGNCQDNPKGLERTMPKIYTRTGIGPVPTSQTGKPYDTWGFR